MRHQAFQKIKRVTRQSIALVTALALLVGVGSSGHAGATAGACPTPSTNLGSVTSNVTVPAAGNYVLWSRIMAADSTNNSYSLEVDQGGSSNCYVVGDSAVPAGSWTWINYQAGSTSSVISQSLNSGTVTLKFIGREPSVKVDRLILTTDTTCVPDNVLSATHQPGDNCVSTPNQIDQTNNLATAKTFTSSDGSDSSGPLGNINDQNETTRWISTVPGAANATVSTDLGKAYSLSQVAVLWAGNTTKDYQLQVSNDNTSWTTVASGQTNNTTPQLINTTSFTSPATGRYFRIVSVDLWNSSYGQSIWEIGLYGTAVTTDTVAPAAPTNLNANATAYNAVSLGWTASTDNVAVNGYYLMRNGSTIATLSNGTSYNDTTVAANTSYSYQVKAFDAAGNVSGNSNTATITTANPPDTSAPSQPTSLQATAVSSSQINIQWAASTDNIGVTGYDVYRGAASATPNKLASVTTTSFGDTGLTANTSYTYYVVARDAAGNQSTASTSVSATTQAASTGTGSLNGTVYDSRTGSGLAGASISVSLNKRNTATYTTNSSGFYSILNLNTATYQVRYGASHFVTQSYSISVSPGTTTSKNVTLNHR